MLKSPPLKAKELIKILMVVGFTQDHIEGSHCILRRDIDRKKIVVPLHGSQPLGKGITHAILKQADLTPDQVIKLRR